MSPSENFVHSQVFVTIRSLRIAISSASQFMQNRPPRILPFASSLHNAFSRSLELLGQMAPSILGSRHLLTFLAQRGTDMEPLVFSSTSTESHSGQGARATLLVLFEDSLDTRVRLKAASVGEG